MQIQPNSKPPLFDMEALSSLLALAKLRPRAALRIQPIRDALTGLYTRRYMNELLKRQVRRAARGQRPFALIFFDINNFQHFNGTHGHVAGDAVLRELGKLLRSTVQQRETPFRIAGDEFVIMLPDTSLEVAVLRAQLIQEECGRLKVAFEGKYLRPPGFSIGLASFPESGSTGEALLHVAEDAIYAVKSRGRARMVVFKSAESD